MKWLKLKLKNLGLQVEKQRWFRSFKEHHHPNSLSYACYRFRCSAADPLARPQTGLCGDVGKKLTFRGYWGGCDENGVELGEDAAERRMVMSL